MLRHIIHGSFLLIPDILTSVSIWEEHELAEPEDALSHMLSIRLTYQWSAYYGLCTATAHKCTESGVKQNTASVSILPIKAELENRKGGSNVSPWNFSIAKNISALTYIFYYMHQNKLRKAAAKGWIDLVKVTNDELLTTWFSWSYKDESLGE